MIARGFKPVAWVGGVAAAALSCYMLSLNVAAERAELKKLEWRIVMAKREIRTLQTELGTRGRLQQLENWNANVLALSAPTADQFVENELTLARFDQRPKTIDDQVQVQMASAETAPGPRIQAPVQLASAPAPAPMQPSLVHRASAVSLPAAKPVVTVVAKPVPKAEKLAQPKKQLAETEVAPAPAKKKLADAKSAAAPAPAKKKLAEAQPAAAPAAKKKIAKIDASLVDEIRAAAKAEVKGSAGGR